MTRVDEFAARAGAAVQEDAQRRAAHAPPMAQVRGRRARRRAGLVGGVAAVAVGTVALTAGWPADSPRLEIDDAIGAPDAPDPVPDRPSPPETDPAPPPAADDADADADPDMLLPGGWVTAEVPIETAGRTVVVASSGTLPAFIVAGEQGMRDAALVVGSDDGWVVHEGSIDHEPDVLATGGVDEGWVLALATGSASLVAADGTAAPVDPMPADLDGRLTGTAWLGEGFVVIGRAAGPDEPTPVFLLDPRTGSWRALPDAPLAVNREWNTAVVSTGDEVYLVGTWLDGSHQPARSRLAAAHLNVDDTWTLLDDGALSPGSADAVAVDDRVLAIDGNGDAAWLDRNGWSPTEPTGIPASECGSHLAVNVHYVLASGCEAAVLDRQAQTWSRLAPPTPREDHTLRRAIATAEGFLVPTARPANFGAIANDLLALEPANAWPLEHGIRGAIARPPGWTIATEPLVDEVADQELATASTAPMPPGGAERCDGLPTAALDRLGPSDAIVSVRTSTEAATDVPALGTLPDLEAGWDKPVPEDCARSDLTLRRMLVRDGPVALELIVAHGHDAPNTVVDEALGIANSYTTTRGSPR